MNELAKIISQLEQQRNSIDRALVALREVEGLKPTEDEPVETPKADVPKKRTLSAAGRRRIIEATKKRWAAKRAAEGAQSGVVAATKKVGNGAAKQAPAKANRKGSLTPEGRQRLADAMKRRWAIKRGPAATKKATGKKAA